MMRFLSIVLLLSSSISFTCAGEITDQPKVKIEYFFQTGCHDCENVSAFILPQLEERFSGRYELHKYDTGTKENILRLIEIQNRLKIDDNPTVAMILNGKIYLGGFDNINDKLFDQMDKCLAEDPVKTPAASTGVPPQRTFSPAAVMLAGLADGVNPCVFSTLIFFITLLLSMKASKIKLLLAGGIYCLACFLTYLSIGFGIFRFLKLFSGYHGLQTALNVILFVALMLLAGLSFLDAWRFRRSGKAESVTLQLPDNIKSQIRSIMHRGLKYHFLLPGIFGIGVMVTVLESVCTGQVYVPTLILLTRETGLASKWFFYLLLYNLMFILPLIGLFLAAVAGTSLRSLLALSKRNVVTGKILMGLLFLILSLVLLRLI